MDELRQRLHLIETDELDEGLNIELKSHFAHPNVDQFKIGEEKRWVVKDRSKEREFTGEAQVQNYFKHACIKSIAAFLNSYGGQLFIGVGDKIDPKDGQKTYFGVQNERRKKKNDESQAEDTNEAFDRDKYKLELLNDLEKHIPESYINKYLTINFIPNGKATVCVIDVKPITVELPVIIKRDGDEVLYRRSDNRTKPVLAKLDIIQFGRDFWSRLENQPNLGSGFKTGLPEGWDGPFKLTSVKLDPENKVITLHTEEMGKPIICKFANKYNILSASCVALEGQRIILSSTGRYTVRSGYFSEIQKW